MWAMMKQVVRSADNICEEVNQFDKTGVDYLCKDTTATFTLS